MNIMCQNIHKNEPKLSNYERLLTSYDLSG